MDIMSKVFKDLMEEIDTSEFSKKMKPKVMMMISKKKPMHEDMEIEEEESPIKKLSDPFGGEDEMMEEKMGMHDEKMKEDMMGDDMMEEEMMDEDEDLKKMKMKMKMKGMA